MKRQSTGIMRYPAYRGAAERIMATLVLRRYNQLVGIPLKRLMTEMEAMGYDVGCKCNWEAHKIDTFRRKLSLPYCLFHGQKLRIFHPNPLSQDENCWINLFLAEDEAVRNPNAPDAAYRQKAFEEIVQAILAKQAPMKNKLNDNPALLGDLHALAQQWIAVELVEQEILPFEEAQ